MSLPSFKLSKRGKKWIATGALPSGRAFEIDCGEGAREKAEGIAEEKIGWKVKVSNASKARWAKPRPHRATTPAPAPAPPRPAPPPLEPETPTPLERPAPPPPPPISDEPLAARTPEENQAIALKLRALGDQRPIEPDGVHGPGEDPRADEKVQEDGEPDEETGELIAELIASGIVSKNISLVVKMLKAQKPPKRPGDGPEKMREWYHAGMVFNLKKLVGKAVALGPTGKMFVGALLFNAAMLWNAEEIEGAAAAPAPRAARAAPEAAPAAAPTPNGSETSAAGAADGARPEPQPHLALVRQEGVPPVQDPNAIGRFK